MKKFTELKRTKQRDYSHGDVLRFDKYTDIDKLKIVKVSGFDGWNVYRINFIYKGVKYNLYEMDTYEESKLLLNKIVNSDEVDGAIEYHNLNSCKGCNLNNMIRVANNCKQVKDLKTLTYSQIDKEWFIKQLMYVGFATSTEFEEILSVEEGINTSIQVLNNLRTELKMTKAKQLEIDGVDKSIKKVEESREELISNWFTTEGKGSKTTSLALSMGVNKVKDCIEKDKLKKENFKNKEQDLGTNDNKSGSLSQWRKEDLDKMKTVMGETETVGSMFKKDEIKIE